MLEIVGLPAGSGVPSGRYTYKSDPRCENSTCPLGNCSIWWMYAGPGSVVPFGAGALVNALPIGSYSQNDVGCGKGSLNEDAGPIAQSTFPFTITHVGASGV